MTSEVASDCERKLLFSSRVRLTAGMVEAGHQFRRVNGHLHLPKLRAALDAHFTGNVTAVSQNEDQKAA